MKDYVQGTISENSIKERNMKIELKPCPFCGDEVMPVWRNNQEEYRQDREYRIRRDKDRCFGIDPRHVEDEKQIRYQYEYKCC